MNTTLLFDFTVNKETRTIHVKREFAADLPLVWKAWTTAELLDQWWAPLPYRNKTKSLELRAGGTWLYSMISPENETHWCRFDYEKIETEKSYSGLDAFVMKPEHSTQIFRECIGKIFSVIPQAVPW